MTDARDNGSASGTAGAFTREETYAATRGPVELAQTLSPAYTSDEFLASNASASSARAGSSSA